MNWLLVSTAFIAKECDSRGCFGNRRPAKGESCTRGGGGGCQQSHTNATDRPNYTLRQRKHETNCTRVMSGEKSIVQNSIVYHSANEVSMRCRLEPPVNCTAQFVIYSFCCVLLLPFSRTMGSVLMYHHVRFVRRSLLSNNIDENHAKANLKFQAVFPIQRWRCENEK